MGGWVKRGGSKFEVFSCSKAKSNISYGPGALSMQIKREGINVCFY